MQEKPKTDKYNPSIHNRRSIRLKGYDYSQPGFYFITICVDKRLCSLGEIRDGKIQLSEEGKFASELPQIIKEKYPYVKIPQYIIMPNHVHAIIEITDYAGRGRVTLPLLGQIVAHYKYKTTKLINQKNAHTKPHFWQRNYDEHIIKNDDELRAIGHYIQENIATWNIDSKNPSNINSLK